MRQLDKWNRELINLSNRRYKQMDGDLYNYYKRALKELKTEIKGYLERYEQLSFSKRLQVDNQLKVARRIDEILSELSGKTTQTVDEFVRDELQLGYNGVWYSVEGLAGIQIDFAMLPERYIEQLVNDRIDGKTLSERLYEYREELAERALEELLRGASTGEGYAKVAKRIGELTEANYKQALRIAITEGGRTQSKAKQAAYEEAEDKGVNLKKRWQATLDEKTRSSHTHLDGQTVGIREKFVNKEGNKADGPRLFGIAKEDIRCRCTTITEVSGISPNTRMDNITKKIIPYKNYKEWAEAKGL